MASAALVKTPDQPTHDTSTQDITFPQHVLNIGFYTGLGLAAACFVFAAFYLFKYLSIPGAALDQLSANKLTDQRFLLEVLARLAAARFCLSACGICAGLAFGFLGFSLFLIGARSQMDATGQGGGMGIQLSRIAPGTFIMLCSVVLIVISIIHKVDLGFKSEPALVPSANAQQPPQSDYKLPALGSDRKP